jgi:hypothetical protein
MLWGLWTVTVAARGFLGTRRTVYSLCFVTPELAEKFGNPALKAGLDTGHIKWVSVSRFTEEDGKALQHFVLNVVQVAPRAQWDILVARELHTRFNETDSAVPEDRDRQHVPGGAN